MGCHVAAVRNIGQIGVGVLQTVLIASLQEGCGVNRERRFTRMLPGMESCSYKERLDRSCLLLEHRRLCGDHIEVYKIMRCVVRIESLPWGRESRVCLLKGTGLR